MGIVLAISGRPLMEVDAEAISIGSDPSSAIVLTDAGIKPRHAVIRRAAGRWMIEARAAETIQVGDAAPARVHWLKPGDMIRLGENGPEITFQPAKGSEKRPEAAAQPPASQSAPPATPPVKRPAETPSKHEIENTKHQPAAPPAKAAADAPPKPAAKPAVKPVAETPRPGSASLSDVGKPPDAKKSSASFEPVELTNLPQAPKRDKSPQVKPLPPPREPVAPAPEQPSKKKTMLIAGAAAGVVVVGIAIVAGWMIFGRGPGPVDNPPPRSLARETDDIGEPSTERNDAGDSQPAPAITTHGTPDDGQVNPFAIAAAQRSLYAVYVQDSFRVQRFRLGTAWAVAPGRLVTSGAVAMAIDELKKSRLKPVVYLAGDVREIPVTKTYVHPAYRRAADDAAAARKELDAAVPEADSSEDKPEAAADTSKQDAARAALARAYATQAGCDLGLLETGVLPSPVLSWDSRPQALPEGERFVVVGLPFKIDDYRPANVSEAHRAARRDGRGVSAGSESSGSPRLRFDAPAMSVPPENWSGSPVLNAAGRVCGVYSRLVEETDLQAISPINRLSELAPDLSPAQVSGEPPKTGGAKETAPQVATQKPVPGDGASAKTAPPKTGSPAPAGDFTNSLGMKLVLIPAGEFLMGTDENPQGLQAEFRYVKLSVFWAERPPHRVRITKPFYLESCEVSMGQFMKFYEQAGYEIAPISNEKESWGYSTKQKSNAAAEVVPWAPGWVRRDDHPAVYVSWNDADAFCKWLSKEEGKTYRLPTEAEWEYACRAGTTTRYSSGNDAEGLVQFANIADRETKTRFGAAWVYELKDGLETQTRIPYPFLSGTDGNVLTAPVGSFQPNAFGIYDMHGNVMEWCQDWYKANAYPDKAEDDPQGPSRGSHRVVRGGGWRSMAVGARSSVRIFDNPDARTNQMGFRVVCEVEGASP